MPDIFPGSALVDIYLELQGQEAFQNEYEYLIRSQEGTPLGRFFDILNEANDEERINKLKDFFLDYHIPFPKLRDISSYFNDFNYKNLESNRELQVVLDLYCYAYEKYALPLNKAGEIEDESQKAVESSRFLEKENIDAIRGELKKIGYENFDYRGSMELGSLELNKEKIRYYINKVHMQDESQIAPNYRELLERSINDYMEVKSPTIENFLSMIGTIEEVLPIIGSKEVKELLLAMDFTKLGESERDAIQNLNGNDAVRKILQDKIKEDIAPNYRELLERSINDYMEVKSPTIEDFLSMIGTIEEVAPIIGAKEVKKLLLAIDFTKLGESERDAIQNLNGNDAVRKILQDKIKEDKVIEEARLILNAYPSSQAAKDLSNEIYALSVNGETVRLTTACKKAYEKYNGDKRAYKKEILKLCDPKIRNTIRQSLEEVEPSLGLSQERASRRPNIIGYARQLFQLFQRQRNERELEISNKSEDGLQESERMLIDISKDVVNSVNDEYGLASTHFREVIKEVRKGNKGHQMFKADTLANDPFVKTGDLISEHTPLSGGRDQIVIDSLGQYCIENKKTPLAEVIDIISKINGLVGLTRQVKSMYESAKEDPDSFKDPLILQVNSYATAHNELVSQLRGTKYANIIPRLEEAKAHLDATPLASLRDSVRHTLR